MLDLIDRNRTALKEEKSASGMLEEENDLPVLLVEGS